MKTDTISPDNVKQKGLKQRMRKVRALLAAVLVCGLLLKGADVFGANIPKIQVSSGTTEAAPGEKITLTFSLAGYDDIQEGIYALKATLEYDPDIFEAVEEPDFETLSGWEQLQYNADNGQFAVINKSGSVKNEDAFRLTLTAKAQAEIKETTILLKDISVSEGKEDIFLKDTEFQMTVNSDEQPENGGGEGVLEDPDETPEDSDEELKIPEKNPEGSGEASDTDREDSAERSSEQQSEEKENVQTGDTDAGVFFFIMILLVSLLILGGILITRTRKKKQNKNGPKLLAGLILCSVLAVSAGVRAEAAAEKGDVDGNGNIDYTDVELIQRHLIELQLLEQDAQEPADINDDGKLTLTDLALLVRRIENLPESGDPSEPSEPEEPSDPEEEIQEAIELKDVTDTTLYYSGDGKTEEIDILDITKGLPEDPENYFAVIGMESLPDLYTGISEFRQEKSGTVSAVIDQADVIRYDADGNRIEEYAFPVAYRDKEGEHPLIKSAQELFDKMAADSKGTFELTEDLDASGISADAPAVAGTFTGELDGNGFRIRNLPTSLFGTLSGAHIHDLVIEDAAVTAQRSGILANFIQRQSIVENVFIVDSSVSNSVDEMGAFAGKLSDSTIRRSASVNVSLRGLVAVGGIVGRTEAGALIEDCYVTGKVQGTYDHPSLGARTGGITGWHGGGKISRCYTNAEIIAPAKKGNGGIIGGPNTGSPVIEYSLSMSTGAGYRIAGFDVLNGVKEVYEYSGSGSSTNVTEANGNSVKETDAVYERTFYEDTLGFDAEIWNLEGLALKKLPILSDSPVEDNSYGIPSYSEVKDYEDYQAERETAYANMAEIMPFADTALWVEYGNGLSASDALAVKKIKYVLPLDEQGAYVAGIHRESTDRAVKVRVVFEDDTRQEYSLTEAKLVGNIVASYGIEGQQFPYQFHNYAAAFNESVLSGLTALAFAYDYNTEIAGITQEDESRLYTDYYNESVKGKLERVLADLFTSQERYPSYCAHPAVKALTEERMKDEEELKRYLYSYNYYDKWYHIDYDGVVLSDLMFFGKEVLSEDINASELTEQLLNASSDWRATKQTVTFYNNVLKNITGKDFMEFLGGFSKSIAGYEDANAWFADTFDGILVEQNAAGDEGRIRYRIWDNLKGLPESRKNIVLPVLTAPQEDMYLISVPSQIVIGSMNRYETYLKKDGQERERVRAIAEEYAGKMGIFYGVSSQWMSNSAEQLNSFVNLQFDTRLSFPESPVASAGAQEKGATRDPVMKWVYESVDMLSALNGSAAVADGTIVIWMWSPALGTDDYTFFTFSHETAHNQDGKYFYGGAGRRIGTGGEAHADGNIAQEMRDGIMVFNISKKMDIGTEMTNNFSYERINSAEKVHSYYKKMFETGYVLDYLAAQAFFELTPQQQAAVAVQAEHTAGGSASMSTTYKKLTAEEIGAMNLNSMEALWDHKISIRNAASYPEKVGTATDGSYGFESFYTMNWYQPHNDSGSPDTHSFKRLGQEMLALAGYEKGYQVYISALSENDLDALRKITGDPNITWRDYKLNRYRDVAQKLDQIPYFDKDAVIAQFKAAFEADTANGNTNQSFETKRMIYGMVKRVTGDFSTGGIYESPAVIPVTSAEELIRYAAQNPYGYYRLEQDIDFTNAAASGGSYIPGRFIGVVDGNGHSLTGMKYPLFGDLQYAQVTDLTISAPSYAGDAQALFAMKTKKVTLGNVKVEGTRYAAPPCEEQDGRILRVRRYERDGGRQENHHSGGIPCNR